MTDASGYAEFDFEAKTTGSYKLEARLTEFPGVNAYQNLNQAARDRLRLLAQPGVAEDLLIDRTP